MGRTERCVHSIRWSVQSGYQIAGDFHCKFTSILYLLHWTKYDYVLTLNKNSLEVVRRRPRSRLRLSRPRLLPPAPALRQRPRCRQPPRLARLHHLLAQRKPHGANAVDRDGLVRPPVLQAGLVKCLTRITHNVCNDFIL